jgi:uncharacterized protein
MPRLILFGATGNLGSRVLRQALSAGHEVTAVVRDPSRLASGKEARLSVHRGDLRALSAAELAGLIAGHDSLISCAGLVTEGQTFVDIVDRVVSGVEAMPTGTQPACWFLAGAAVLEIGESGRRGVDLPKIRSLYWPHRVNFERLARSGLNWRLLCPGPMVDEPPLGAHRLRIALDRLPVEIPALAGSLPDLLLLPFFARLIPQMIVPYADAAAVMLAHIGREDAMSRHRVGLALPAGMRGHKDQWTARPRPTSGP